MNRLAGIALGLLLACGAELSTPASNPDPGTDPGTGPGTGSGACGSGAPAAGVTNGSLDVAGVRRTFVLVLPTAEAGEPLPVYFVFHGAGGTGQEFRNWMRFESNATRPGIFVYPDGLADSGGSTGWPNTGGRDVAFFDALLAHVKTRACVDEQRVFATGFSYGGYMSNTLGCARAGVVRAIAPLSGGLFSSRSCTRVPAAVWISHGTTDDPVPLTQGEAARNYWTSVNGCGSGTSAVEPAPCRSYQGCAAGNPVVWCQFDGGHEVPSWVYKGVMGFFEALR